MLILFIALIFGIVVFLILLKGMPDNFRAQLRGRGTAKVGAIIRAVLLIEIVIYILVFVIVIIKTIFI